MVALLALSVALAADSETVISANPLGVMGFTLHNIADFAVNAEHVRGHHGALAEISLVHVHGNPTHCTVLGGRLGYRWHFMPDDAPFVGVIAGFGTGYVKYFPDRHHDPDNLYRFDVKQVLAIPHVGYRWSIGDHVRVTSRIGAGYGRHDVTSDLKGDEIDAAITLTEDRLQFTPIKLDFELSLGVAF